MLIAGNVEAGLAMPSNPVRLTVADGFREEGFEVIEAAKGDEAIALLVLGVLTLWTFEYAAIKSGLIGLNTVKIHSRRTFWARWAFDRTGGGRDVFELHDPYPL